MALYLDVAPDVMELLKKRKAELGLSYRQQVEIAIRSKNLKITAVKA